MEQPIQFEGSVTEVIYFNKENGYSVFDFFVESEGVITCTGNLPFVNPGESLVLMGDWTHHPSYGKQFKVQTFVRPEPGCEAEILSFLASGILPGVRRATAEKMVSRFGADTLHVLEDTPERIAEIKGISVKKAYEIHRAYLETKDLEQLIMFMQRHGIATRHAMKLYERYGSRAVSTVTANPYLLCAVLTGVGFKTADGVAQSLGVRYDDANRIRAGVQHTLTYAAFSGGHTYLPRKILISAASELLQVDTLMTENAVVSLLAEGLLVCAEIEGQEGIFLPVLYQAERRLGQALSDLSKKESEKSSLRGIEKEITTLEDETGIFLAERQKEAVISALSSGFSIITGGPGTGKTTTIRFLIEAYKKRKKKIALCAPTGRAAKRMSQLSGQEAKTVHRLLEAIFVNDDELFRDYSKNEGNPLEEDVIIMDEASMADVLLLEALTNAIKPGASLILVGDSDQLPPVGAGNALKDAIHAGKAPVVRLDTVFRQAEESQIVQNAHRINRGEQPLYNVKDGDFFFMGARDAEDLVERLSELVCHRLPAAYGYDPLTDIQVITPMKKTTAGVNHLNTVLQQALNPPRKGKREHVTALRTLREGDKVMQVKNNYELPWEAISGPGEGVGVYNGDIGMIESIEAEAVSVIFDGERRVLYKPSMLDELALAYAITVHKSQGSEFPVVVMPVFHGVPQLMTRNLIYTAVTRAMKLVVLVGQKSAVEKMVGNDFEEKRYSALQTWLV
ncbi:MAG: ATP-dependent RecD-like DNA helicase [Ruminococcaceae bacterium]|nr:ATP-dependent RecD-like DNA helicase [Oscillospiraceae bacterium]